MEEYTILLRSKLKSVFKILKSVNKSFLTHVKAVWSSYGYYISLACLLLLFGVTAYLYRSNHVAGSEYLPLNTHSIAAMANLSTTIEPSSSPVPYEPSFQKPVDGDISVDYSPDQLVWNETLGAWCVHNGLDISAVSGTAVYAAEKGTVSAVYEDSEMGNVIEITHEDGWVTKYCSIETLELVNIGKHVEKGDIISSVGATAIVESSDGPHLHFELLHNGEHIPPEFE